MKAFLIAFNSRFATREQVQDYLNSEEDVSYWYACLPHCVFCTSSLSAQDLAKRIESHVGSLNGKRFIVLEVGVDRQGRLPKKAWHMFRHPDNPHLPE